MMPALTAVAVMLMVWCRCGGNDGAGGAVGGGVGCATSAPSIGERVRSLTRDVSSLYKGRSALLDDPVPDGLAEPLVPTAGPSPPLSGARLHRLRECTRLLRAVLPDGGRPVPGGRAAAGAAAAEPAAAAEIGRAHV